jgi:predicted histone-like DNA-binding protein
MAIKFEFYETPNVSGEKTGKYHARAVTYKTVTTDEVARNIQVSSSFTLGDVKGMLTALSNEIAKHLSGSNRVHLEGIGYFQATLGCRKEVINPKKTHAQNVAFKSVRFRADEELKDKLRYVMTIRSKVKKHSSTLTREEVDRRVAIFFQSANYLTRKRLETLCGINLNMAIRHINRLKKEGKIKNINTRWQPIYVQVVKEPEGL